MVALGVLGYLLSIISFLLYSHGSPAMWHSPRLMVKGIYHFTRNPMYISGFLVLAGQALCFQSLQLLYYLLGMAVIFLGIVYFVEEPFLSEQFGESYEEYRKAEPRWIPRMGGKK